MSRRRSSWLGGDAETYRTTPRRDCPWLASNSTQATHRTRTATPDVAKFVPVRCPKCSAKASTYKTAVPVRYHRCSDPTCKTKFRSVECED